MTFRSQHFFIGDKGYVLLVLLLKMFVVYKYFIATTADEQIRVKRSRGIILTGKSKLYEVKPAPVRPMSTTNCTWPVMHLNLGLCGDRLATTTPSTVLNDKRCKLTSLLRPIHK
jgi:hypothetical protein